MPALARPRSIELRSSRCQNARPNPSSRRRSQRGIIATRSRSRIPVRRRIGTFWFAWVPYPARGFPALEAARLGALGLVRPCARRSPADGRLFNSMGREFEDERPEGGPFQHLRLHFVRDAVRRVRPVDNSSADESHDVLHLFRQALQRRRLRILGLVDEGAERARGARPVRRFRRADGADPVRCRIRAFPGAARRRSVARLRSLLRRARGRDEPLLAAAGPAPARPTVPSSPARRLRPAARTHIRACGACRS